MKYVEQAETYVEVHTEIKCPYCNHGATAYFYVSGDFDVGESASVQSECRNCDAEFNIGFDVRIDLDIDTIKEPEQNESDEIQAGPNQFDMFTGKTLQET